MAMYGPTIGHLHACARMALVVSLSSLAVTSDMPPLQTRMANCCLMIGVLRVCVLMAMVMCLSSVVEICGWCIQTIPRVMFGLLIGNASRFVPTCSVKG